MRHYNKKRLTKFGDSYQKAMIKMTVRSFFNHEKIKTTTAKAKQLKPIIEKIITLGKRQDLSARRRLISLTGSQGTAKKIINDISPRYKTRPGGYTKIIKLGQRAGDAASIVYLTLV